MYVVMFAAISGYFLVVVVPAGHFRATKMLGKYRRILRPGVHVLHPFEEIVRMSWTELEETVDGRTEIKAKTVTDFPLLAKKFDPPSIAVRTRDRQNMNFNGAAWWKISSPSDPASDRGMFEFFEKNADPINLMHEMYKQAVASVLVKISSADVATYPHDELAELIRKELGTLMAGTCIEITCIGIQGITYMRDMEQKISQDAAASQALAAELQQVAVRERIMQANAAIELQKANHAAEVRVVSSGSEARSIAVIAAARSEAESLRLRAVLKAIREAGVEGPDVAKVYESVAREKLYGTPGVVPSVILTPDLASVGDGNSHGENVVAAALLREGNTKRC